MHSSLFRDAVIGITLVAVSIFSWLEPDAALFPPNHSLMAFIQCNDFAAARFEVPDTEKFALHEYEADATENETYSIRSYIDTRNGGAPGSRINYFCKVRWDGNEEILPSSWPLLELRIVDQTQRTDPPKNQGEGA